MQRSDEASGRYLPVIYPEELPYWEALKQQTLKLQRCRSCAMAWFPIGPSCPHCLSSDFEWAPMSGRGTVHNFVIYHRAWTPWLEKRVPYAVIQVELDEGPRLTTNLHNCTPEEIRIGMRVEAIFERVTEDITLLQFQPAGKR